MIEPDSKHLKTLPEQYFTIPKGEKVDPDVLAVTLSRIGTMVDLLVNLEESAYYQNEAQGIGFILEGMVYQAKELAFKMGEMK